MVTPERYWNTWHPVNCAWFQHIPTGLSIIPGAFSEVAGAYSQFPFDSETRLYEHTPDGSYCRMRVTHAVAEFEIEYLKTDPWTVLLRMTNLREPLEWGIRYHMLVSLGFDGKAGTMAAGPDGVVGSYENYRMATAFYGEEPYDAVPAKDSHVVGDAMADKGYKTSITAEGEEPGWVTCRYVLEQTKQLCLAVSIAHDTDTAAHNAKEACATFADWDAAKSKLLASYPGSQDETHTGMLEAVQDVMAWNAMYSPVLNRTYTSIAKTWNKNFGGWYLFFSDACYQVLMTAMAGDFTAAADNLDYVLSVATPDGNFTGMYSPWQKWVDRTQPPVLGYCLWTYYQLSGDITALQKGYPILRRAQKWYQERRTDGSCHLIRLGSSPTGDGSYRGSKLAAKNETAMDNSPMYDEAEFDKETGLLKQYDIGVSSQYLLDLEMAARMAEELGLEDDRTEILTLCDTLRREINETLWDSETGMYRNANLDGTFGLTSPTSFYPLAAGVPDRERCEASMEHIFNEEEFFTECPLIAINASDPSARENKYWRGRTWAPQSFWTYLGLRRCGQPDAAGRLADHAVRYFRKHWEADRRSYENFNPFTGSGTDSVDTQPFYSWTALLPLMWSMEFCGVNPWEGVYFGHPKGCPFRQKNRIYRGKRYDITCDGAKTTVTRNGRTILCTDMAGRISNIVLEQHSLRMTVPGSGTLELPETDVTALYVNGKPATPSNRINLPEGTHRITVFFGGAL